MIAPDPTLDDAGLEVVESALAEPGPLDVHALYKLRVDVFVVEQDCPYAEIGARAQLEQWYGQFGFVRTGPDYLDGRIPHLPMRRDLLG